MKPVPDPAHIAVDFTMREDRGRLIAALAVALGDFDLAEECLSEAIEAALTAWARDGVPKSRVGWLLQVARRRAIDRLRRAQNFARKAAQIAVLEQDAAQGREEHDIPDHRLRLIFTCCHPALEEKTRVALTLRTVGGLSTEEVARAFLDRPAAMAARLSRARKKISAAGIGFEIPDGEALNERMRSVLQVIYLIFNEGYAATNGAGQVRIDLCREAVFLARLMEQFCPEDCEVSGLLALILLTDARRDARQNADGSYAPLDAQDRALWNVNMIAQGQAILTATLARGQVGPYQLQAAIGALHCEAATAEDTDWAQITALYRLLVQIEDSAVARLNLGVAVSYSIGPAEALGALERLADELSRYQPYHAARADILRRLGQKEAAIQAYDVALDLTNVESERRFLLERRHRL